MSEGLAQDPYVVDRVRPSRCKAPNLPLSHRVELNCRVHIHFVSYCSICLCMNNSWLQPMTCQPPVSVISMPRHLCERLDPSDDSSGGSVIDYSEKRSLPISIPDYQTTEHGSERFVVRHLSMEICFVKCN